MHAGLPRIRYRLGITLPFEELAKWEMLNNWELAQYFRIVHLDHTFVDLSPAVFDTGDIEQDRRVLPERTLFDVQDELDGAVVHVAGLVLVYGWFGGDRVRLGC